MRIWTLHPQYLDPQGLVALWRETLLAQKVLLGRTKGYTHHPQLQRFRAAPDPIAAVATYLASVHDEAQRRGYRFDCSKIADRRLPEQLDETSGQLLYEWQHLQAKLKKRNQACHDANRESGGPIAHPLFRIVDGEINEWERTALQPRRRTKGSTGAAGRAGF
jgi:hypothetical protein